MDLGQWLPVHFPSQYYLVSTNLTPRYGDNIVVDLALFEVGIDAHELEVLGAFFQAATVLEDLLQADSGPFRRANRAFSPA